MMNWSARAVNVRIRMKIMPMTVIRTIGARGGVILRIHARDRPGKQRIFSGREEDARRGHHRAVERAKRADSDAADTTTTPAGPITRRATSAATSSAPFIC